MWLADDGATSAGRMSEGSSGFDALRLHRAALKLAKPKAWGRRHTSPGQRPGITSGNGRCALNVRRMFHDLQVDRGMRRPDRARQGRVPWNTRGVAPGWNAMPLQGIQLLIGMSFVSDTAGKDDYGMHPDQKDAGRFSHFSQRYDCETRSDLTSRLFCIVLRSPLHRWFLFMHDAITKIGID